MIAGLLVITSFSALTFSSWSRSSVDLAATSRFVTTQQAFYLAEAGLDQKLVEFRDADTSNDTRNAGAIAQGPGSYTVTVTSRGGGVYELASVGQSGSSSKTLRMTIKKRSNPPLALGATTIVGEGGIDFQVFQYANPLVMNGCDLDSAACLPAMSLTADQLYAEASAEVDSVAGLGLQLLGAQGDHPDSVQLLSGKYTHSITFDPQDISNGGLGYSKVNSLVAYAKANADPSCNINAANDDGSSSSSLSVTNRILGTAAAPKVCYLEAPLNRNEAGQYTGGGHEIDLDNVTGTGVLVLVGGLHSKNLVDYQGVMVVAGPEMEFEPSDTFNVTGSLIMGTTETSASGTKIKPEFDASASGLIQYSSSALDTAMDLLSGWTPPYDSSGSSSGGSVTIETWQSF